MIRKRHDLDIQIIVSSQFADPWIYFRGRREDQDLVILQDIRRLGQSIQSQERAPREMLISFNHYQAAPRWRTQRPQVAGRSNPPEFGLTGKTCAVIPSSRAISTS